MTPTKYCPACTALLPMSGECPECSYGHQRPGTGGAGVDAALCCPWVEQGVVCGVRGCVSDGAGAAGPWYCRPHYARLKGWRAASDGQRPLTFRERWYAERGLPYEPPKVGNFAVRLPAQLPPPPPAPRQREPGDDDDDPDAVACFTGNPEAAPQSEENFI